ncbi:Methyltransferase type 11 [Macleaya cordata]|uniref:Methyltransferase type 11 n=1 Tax=Macleaya cordata TaxID=56857 RepID=A0A200PSK1_MACCD|nr:Methyltransferase type 11 [Macleaya cordata]
MKTATRTKPLVLRPLILSVFLSLTVLSLIILFLQPHYQKTTTNSSIVSHQPRKSFSEDNKNNVNGGTDDLRIRPGFNSYDSYIKRQLDKTLNPKLRKVWMTRDWDRKINVFSKFFSNLRNENLLSNDSKALCIGARVGQEVAALKRIGVADSVGIDLVPYPPLVLKGDFHDQPFENNTFDFEFSNVFDHALYPSKFVGEIERTLKPGGVCVLHVALSRRADKYSANDLYSVGPLMKMFRVSEVVHVRSVDGFGLDTEVVFRKKINNQRL